MAITTHLHGHVRYPQLHDRHWLVDRYVTQRRTAKDIAEELGCAHGTVTNALLRQRIDRATYVPEHYGHQYYRCPHCDGTGRIKR